MCKIGVGKHYDADDDLSLATLAEFLGNFIIRKAKMTTLNKELFTEKQFHENTEIVIDVKDNEVVQESDAEEDATGPINFYNDTLKVVENLERFLKDFVTFEHLKMIELLFQKLGFFKYPNMHQCTYVQIYVHIYKYEV